MKLFITNKAEFEDEIKNSKEVHKRAYGILNQYYVKGYIPRLILPEIDPPAEKCAVLNLTGIQADKEILFFEFTGVVS